MKRLLVILMISAIGPLAHAANGSIEDALGGGGQSGVGQGSGGGVVTKPSLASLSIALPVMVMTSSMDSGAIKSEPAPTEIALRRMITGVAATAVSPERTQPTLRLYRGF